VSVAGDRGRVENVASHGETVKSKTTPLTAAIALVPVIALTLGIPLANRVDPRIFGMPFLPAYIALWIVLTPPIMLAVYRLERRA
jgi:hypothetical protein